MSPEVESYVYPISLLGVEELKQYLYPSMIFPVPNPNHDLKTAYHQVVGGTVLVHTVPSGYDHWLYGFVLSGASLAAVAGNYASLNVDRVAPLNDLILSYMYAGINLGNTNSMFYYVPIKLTVGDKVNLTAQPATMLGHVTIFYAETLV